jgi:hypothetical protein
VADCRGGGRLLCGRLRRRSSAMADWLRGRSSALWQTGCRGRSSALWQTSCSGIVGCGVDRSSAARRL